MKKVKLLKSICGAYQMAHFGGEEIEISEALAEDMVQNGFAVYIESESPEIETAELKSKPEKAVKKSK